MQQQIIENRIPCERRGLTFEKICAIFQESDRKWEKIEKEIRREMDETSRIVGMLGSRFGELVEHMVVSNIKEKFNTLGFAFEESSQHRRIFNDLGRSIAEIDIVLENSSIVMAVGIKAKPLEKDIDDHIDRMEILRRYADAHNDSRKFLGAITGAIMMDTVRLYAHEAGFYVIEQTGDTVQMTVPSGFTPGVW
jgi:hypothetical protein